MKFNIIQTTDGYIRIKTDDFMELINELGKSNIGFIVTPVSRENIIQETIDKFNKKCLLKQMRIKI